MAIEAYLEERFWQEDDLLRQVREDLAERGPLIQVSAETGRLLATLVTAAGAGRLLEVGTLFGYSGIWMARALREGGHLDTIELSDLHAAAATNWFERAGLADRITVHRGPALDVLATLIGPYDMVFIDAAKAEYPDYLERALPLVRPGGLIATDNIRWGGRLTDPEETGPDVDGIRRYIERVASDERLASTVLPIGDGVAVSVKL